MMWVPYRLSHSCGRESSSTCFSQRWAARRGGLNIEFLWRPADKLKSAINSIILNKAEDDAEEFKVNAICLCGGRRNQL